MSLLIQNRFNSFYNIADGTSRKEQYIRHCSIGQVRAAGGTHNDCQWMNKNTDNQQWRGGFIVDSQSAVLSNLVGQKVDNMNDLAWGLEQ